MRDARERARARRHLITRDGGGRGVVRPSDRRRRIGNRRAPPRTRERRSAVDHIPREPTACPSPRITLDDTGAVQREIGGGKDSQRHSSRRRRCTLDSARATYREGESSSNPFAIYIYRKICNSSSHSLSRRQTGPARRVVRSRLDNFPHTIATRARTSSYITCLRTFFSPSPRGTKRKRWKKQKDL